MKLSNFELTKTLGTSPMNWVFFADVDVETGLLWWKKKVCVGIRREYGANWHFVDTGEFTPGFQAEALARSWRAKTGQQA